MRSLVATTFGSGGGGGSGGNIFGSVVVIEGCFKAPSGVDADLERGMKVGVPGMAKPFDSNRDEPKSRKNLFKKQ